MYVNKIEVYAWTKMIAVSAQTPATRRKDKRFDLKNIPINVTKIQLF
jgi:hypothetical protein